MACERNPHISPYASGQASVLASPPEPHTCLQMGKRTGMRVEIIPEDNEGDIDLSAAENLIQELSPVLIAISHVPTSSGDALLSAWLCVLQSSRAPHSGPSRLKALHMCGSAAGLPGTSSWSWLHLIRPRASAAQRSKHVVVRQQDQSLLYMCCYGPAGTCLLSAVMGGVSAAGHRRHLVQCCTPKALCV